MTTHFQPARYVTLAMKSVPLTRFCRLLLGHHPNDNTPVCLKIWGTYGT